MTTQTPSSPEIYRNTQFATVVVSALAFSLLMTLVLGQLVGWPAVVLVVAAMLAGLLTLFYSLTTVVTPQELRIAFGPGWISKTIPLATIRSAVPDRSRVLVGWGIRYWLGRGWVWNASGLDIVVLEFTDGHEFRVGTDDPDGLARAIREARAHVNV